MKRWFAMLLAAAITLSMAACTADKPAETTPPTTTAATTEATTEPTTAPEKLSTGVYGDTIILGNLKFAIPEGLLTTVIDEQTIYLSTKDKKFVIGLFALDVSALDVEKTKTFIPIQHKSFADEDDLADSDKLDGSVAGTDVKFDFYTDIDANHNVTINMATTFTDSWYAYTIIMIHDAKSDDINNYISTFVDFTFYAENIGEAPRFDFVQ